MLFKKKKKNLCMHAYLITRENILGLVDKSQYILFWEAAVSRMQR